MRADAGKLRQVLINLIGNAVKYTAQGAIHVVAETRRSGSGLTLGVDVVDTGMGISPDDQSRIFDPFIQATHRRTEGAGLGLAITRRFLEVMGGSITVQSTPGKGSTFHFELPVEEVAENASDRPQPVARRVVGLAPGQPDYRVLIVEDRKENWLVLSRILESAGFQVQVAEDGDQALRVVPDWRPHFIWMDLRLPGMNGIQVTEQIRRMDAGREIRIAALSASAFSTERSQTLAAGMDAFLRKPFRQAEVFACMEKLLGVRYVYSDESEPNATALFLREPALSNLPAPIRADLEGATLALDAGRIAAVIARISETDVALADALKAYADQFAYSKILKALRPAAADGS